MRQPAKQKKKKKFDHGSVLIQLEAVSSIFITLSVLVPALGWTPCGLGRLGP